MTGPQSWNNSMDFPLAVANSYAYLPDDGEYEWRFLFWTLNGGAPIFDASPAFAIPNQSTICYLTAWFAQTPIHATDGPVGVTVSGFDPAVPPSSATLAGSPITSVEVITGTILENPPIWTPGSTSVALSTKEASGLSISTPILSKDAVVRVTVAPELDGLVFSKFVATGAQPNSTSGNTFSVSAGKDYSLFALYRTPPPPTPCQELVNFLRGVANEPHPKLPIALANAAEQEIASCHANGTLTQAEVEEAQSLLLAIKQRASFAGVGASNGVYRPVI